MTEIVETVPTPNQVTDSILDMTKKMIGFESDYTAFDLDIITHINSTFFALQQLGIGPESGFVITDKSSKWSDYLTGNDLSAVKTYMFLKVRLLFDPPTTSFANEAIKNQITELEWRLNVQSERRMDIGDIE